MIICGYYAYLQQEIFDNLLIGGTRDIDEFL